MGYCTIEGPDNSGARRYWFPRPCAGIQTAASQV